MPGAYHFCPESWTSLPPLHTGPDCADLWSPLSHLRQGWGSAKWSPEHLHATPHPLLSGQGQSVSLSRGQGVPGALGTDNSRVLGCWG